jgi:SAM-dependent methyltransferase
MTREDLGERSDIAAVRALVALEGLRVVDIGCGPGLISRELAAGGATVLGVEPDPIQAEKNRNAAPITGVTFTEAGAERLPVETGSRDGVFFFRSLHHVPIPLMEDALAEAARVLKPDGFLYIAEPSVEGTHFPVMRPFHDETHVRAEAQAALDRAAARLFRSEARYLYVQHPRHKSFEAMVERVTGQTFNNIKREEVETAEVRALFEAGRSNDGDYVFEQPMLLNFYKAPLRP